MSHLAALILLLVGALAAPAAIVLVEWARTVMGFFNLAPGIPFIPNGFENFYIIIAAVSVIVGIPLGLRRITRGEFGYTRYLGPFVLILICWKVIDISLWSDSAAELGSGGMAANLVLSVGTFVYAALATLVFWLIAVRPHQKIAEHQSTEGNAE
jgi:hypothetical protein